MSNIIILLSAYLLERNKPKKSVLRKQLVYSPVDFSIINNVDLLKKELETMLNMPLIKVTVEKINITKNELTVIICYKVTDNQSSINNINSKVKYTR